MKTQETHYPSFRRWVGKQSGAYTWKDTTLCPMAQWAREVKGFKNPSAGLIGVRDREDDDSFLQIVGEDGGLMVAILTEPLTYEALTKRLDAAFTKTGLRRRQKPWAPYVPTGPLGSFKRGASA